MEKAASCRAANPEFLDLVETNPTRVGLVFEPAPMLTLDATYAPDPMGLLPARQAVAEYYGPGVHADDIVLTASTSEAYSFLFKLLADAGDEILVPVPSYPLFEHLTRLEGLTPVPYTLGYVDGGWRIDERSIAHARSTRSRALIVVHPNNPTGSFLHREDGDRLPAGVPVIADEVFFEYADPRLSLVPERVASMHSESLTFSLGGLSKLCALPQAKLAWIRVSGPEAQKRAALDRLAFIADAYLSVGTGVQDAAPRLLANRFPMQRRIHERVSRNASALEEALRGASGLVERARQGGWYSVLELPGAWTGDTFAEALLDRSVLVHPGYFYDFEEENLIVTSLLTPETAWKKGIDLLVSLA